MWPIYDILVLYNFKGVPFAKPPIGDLRFKAPERFDGEWENGKLDATRAPICPQLFEGITEDSTMVGTEDCLYLSLYVPKNALDNNLQLPVYLYFHGGAYLGGASGVVDGAYIASTQNLGRDHRTLLGRTSFAGSTSLNSHHFSELPFRCFWILVSSSF